MDRVYIKTEILIEQSHKANTIMKNIYAHIEELLVRKKNLNFIEDVIQIYDEKLTLRLREMSEQLESCGSLGEYLSQMALIYTQAEANIAGALSPISVVFSNVRSTNNEVYRKLNGFSNNNGELTLNGVELNEWDEGDFFQSTDSTGTLICDKTTKKTHYVWVDGQLVYVASAQCFAYARYVQQKIYDCNSATSPEKFQRVATSVSAATLRANGCEKLKQIIQSAGVGAHIRTNGNKHSMIITEVSEYGFTVIDANSDGKGKVVVTTYNNWDEYFTKHNSYGNRGIDFVEKYIDRG